MSVIDAVVIGGGPAGSAIGRLLAAWGHSVRILNKPVDRSRGLGESLPPSTKKLLDAIDALDLVDRAGFYRTTGNTVWWASRERRVEKFDPSGEISGYQVFRPDFDRVLLEHAASAGADVREAIVRRVELREAGLNACATEADSGSASAVAQRGKSAEQDLTIPTTPGAQPFRVAVEDLQGAVVEYEQDGRRETTACRFVVDASGRAGVVAKSYRRHEPNHRMYALVGVWDCANASCRAEASSERACDASHTVVETYEDGWAWSVPISETIRHVGTMVDGTSPRVAGGRALADAYRGEIDKTIQIARMLDEATLQHAFACDASLYSSDTYAGSRFLLVGDAGSFIDPLSSFGVKKALASAWVGAVVVHTCLTHPDREPLALDFFTQWERDVSATHLRRSRDFARAAYAQHPHPFWARRAETEVGAPSETDEAALMRDGEVQAAFETLKQSDDVEFVRAESVNFVAQPVIRGREIVLEDAIPLTVPVAQPSRPGGVRFLNNVDLVALAELTRQPQTVPTLFEAYRRAHAPVPLPNILGALSFLIAKGILTSRRRSARPRV
jgi:flavin-dependent dehydrogenase